MRQGVIDMAVGSTINWSPQVAELNLFALPFLMPDFKALDAITSGARRQEAVRHRRVPRTWCRSPGGENGFRELSNSKRDVKTPEDPQRPEDPRRRLASVSTRRSQRWAPTRPR